MGAHRRGLNVTLPITGLEGCYLACNVRSQSVKEGGWLGIRGGGTSMIEANALLIRFPHLTEYPRLGSDCI